MFGCHAALVLRRLRRVCAREYQRDPRFIVASATIANPREHIRTLLGARPCASVTLLDDAGACRIVCATPAPDWWHWAQPQLGQHCEPKIVGLLV